MEKEKWQVIFVYSREQALTDGVLVDVTDAAREAGIRYPTALTQAVWDAYVRVPEGADCQDVRGRLWDIVWMFRCAARTNAHAEPQSELLFQLYVRNDNRKAELVTLKAVCGPGDNADPVITIMLEDED